MKKGLTFSVAAMLVGLALPAQADDHHKNRLQIPPAKWLSVPQVLQKLKAQGYNVTKIEADDGVYEFDATNSDGVRIEGHANPETGEILTGYDD
ncbi:PepSY domain-containing protein [Hyphomicrobium sp.]|jgi:hypothetical protein|uniref:PepSY domain-containing protein n=1 Tax=Hyphomicrobium sp. TaxID=82 RepID=UPI002D17627A|nr:PepSY domain-containing protein [Hyphomicrobium sp.]HVZ06207.1 PepSY domain-containing protein [Hyphomicrobium sp.]